MSVILLWEGVGQADRPVASRWINFTGEQKQAVVWIDSVTSIAVVIMTTVWDIRWQFACPNAPLDDTCN